MLTSNENTAVVHWKTKQIKWTQSQPHDNGRRLSAPVPPSHWSGLGLRLHHSADTSSCTRAASPTQTLASLRWLGLERRLLGMAGMVGAPGTPFSSLPSTPTLDDARQWASTALDMLSDIRAEVGYADILAYLPDIELPQLPEWPSIVDEDFLDGARNGIHLEYHPQCMEVLSTHLTTFREHLSSLTVPFPSLYSSEVSSSFPFASVAEALETLVMAVQSELEESYKGDEDKLRPRPNSLRRKSMVERGAEFMTDVRDGFEANVDAMREQQEEMMETIGEQLSSMREGFDHMKEGFHENLTNMRDNFNHELDLIGHELTAIRDEIGHEFDALKDEMQVMASEVRAAVQRSLHGVHLISYADLPQDWKNNPFVTTGYRFIPIERWSLLIKSVFACHNETLNIHTHLIPFLIWFSNLVFFNLTYSYIVSLSSAFNSTVSPHLHHALDSLASRIPYIGTLPPWLDLTASYTMSSMFSASSTLASYYTALTSSVSSLPTPPFPFALTPIIQARGASDLLKDSAMEDPIEFAFMAFALLCLFSSAVWHTMTGCADKRSMEFCARCDYIGIGWLISASVATVVYYGFHECNPTICAGFLCLCLCTGLMGNVFPFMKWFNMHEYRMYRVAFFLALAFSALVPLITLGQLHSYREMYDFVCVIIPSLLSYIIGLIFYASHAPERWLPDRVRQKLDVIGGGSHAIWHCFIVLAVSQHKAAIPLLKAGMQCRP
ncbi:hemolysin-III related-domain-containing protein [Coprinopsis sp. MPI-PUGE-AT-0042]|nr:hemolysin-III related-domain-containing protein [Coprinopsis sp. MPI-PUGE-AT-0042]